MNAQFAQFENYEALFFAGASIVDPILSEFGKDEWDAIPCMDSQCLHVDGETIDIRDEDETATDHATIALHLEFMPLTGVFSLYREDVKGNFHLIRHIGEMETVGFSKDSETPTYRTAREWLAESIARSIDTTLARLTHAN